MEDDLLLKQLIGLLRVPESDRWVFSHQCGIGLLEMFQRTHRIDDLNCAITIQEKCLELIPNEDFNRAEILSTLGVALT